MKNNFLWGGSTSAFQYEGGAAEGGKGLSVYDVMKNRNYQTASDFYHHWKEDIDLIAEMGFKAFRLSISWTRILPDGEGEINEEGINFYIKIFKALRQRNIEPVVTLYHWDMPQSLIEKYNGWYGKEIIRAFEHYVDVCLKYFGCYVHYWLTLNEANLTKLLPTFGTGLKIQENDPEFPALRQRVLMNTYEAHFTAVRKIHEAFPESKVGCMIASSLAYPFSPDPEDVRLTAAHNQDLTYNFLNVLTTGIQTTTEINEMKKAGIKDIENRHKEWENKIYHIDFISFSYYFTVCIGKEQHVKNNEAETVQMMYEALKNPCLKQSTFGWTIDPIGLRILMDELWNRYHLPLMIVENGLGVKDDVLNPDGTIHDSYRIEYLRQHIKEMKKAIDEDGVECLGYLPWGCIDLLSASGDPDKRYGFVYVDYSDNYTRYKKDSFSWYQKVISSNGEDLQ